MQYLNLLIMPFRKSLTGRVSIMRKEVQIVGVFDVNALLRLFGSDNIQLGQSVLLSEEDLARELNVSNAETLPVVETVQRVAPPPTGNISQILYRHEVQSQPSVLSENEVERIVNNDPTMDEEALDAFLNNDQVQCFTDMYDFLDWVPENALPGDKLTLKDMLGNIVATVSVPRHFNAN